MRVIDVHAHIFPDKIADRATAATADYFNLTEPLYYHGSVGELTADLQRGHIDYARVFSAATKPHQVESINRFIFSEAAKHPQFIPCGTLHAAYENFVEELRWLREHGIHGIKLHPEMQRFYLDDPRLFPMFEEMAAHDMFLIAHMGDPRVRFSGPERMIPIAEAFPTLRLIAAHLGDWGEWEVERIRPLAQYSNVYADISSSFSERPGDPSLFACMEAYDPTHLFFGSDYPFWSPAEEVEKTRRLGFSEDLLEDILFRNFARFYHYKKL